MLREIGVGSAEELYESIPAHLRLGRRLDLPDPFPSEYDLRRHVEGLLKRNRTCDDYLNFRGAGCWQHYVPAVCDEINSRGEFLTAYGGPLVLRPRQEPGLLRVPEHDGRPSRHGCRQPDHL